MAERVMTLHPEGKAGVNISKQRYDVVRGVIVHVLRTHGTRTFMRLLEEVRCILEGKFEGSINWYVTTIKLDLEARHIIERLTACRPQKLRLARS
jgi:hypothetical protein